MPKRRKNPESSESQADEPSSESEKPKKRTKKIAKKTEDKPSGKKSKPQQQKSAKKDQPEKRKARTEGKEDFLPGQKYAYPPEEDGAAQFYRTLYQQNPKSEIAQKYVLEYGLLTKEKAEKLYKQISKKK